MTATIEDLRRELKSAYAATAPVANDARASVMQRAERLDRRAPLREHVRMIALASRHCSVGRQSCRNCIGHWTRRPEIVGHAPSHPATSAPSTVSVAKNPATDRNQGAISSCQKYFGSPKRLPNSSEFIMFTSIR